MATNRSSSAPTNVSKNLKGISFPASRDDLLQRAKKNGAGDDVLETIRNMPERAYGTMADVMKGYAGKR